MYPILFDSKATSFTTNGIGRLSDASECKVIEERNGSFELEMDYPMTGIHFKDLSNGNIIYTRPSQNGKFQAFRIYRIERKVGGLCRVYARHISYQLSFIPVTKFSAASCKTALNGLKTHATENCPFNFSTDITSVGTLIVDKPGSLRTFLGGDKGSVLDIWHGEYEWDNYNVILHKNRGSDKGVKIVYGKNLIDLSQEENIENTVTGIFPFWQSQGNQTTDGHTLYSKTTAEWNAETELVPNQDDVYVYTDYKKVTNSDGTYTYTPGYKVGDGETLLSNLEFLSEDDDRLLTAVTYVELDEKIVYSDKASNFPFKRSVVEDFTQVFENAPSQEQLRDYTKQFIKENDIGVPKVTLNVKFINLFETPEYKDVAALQTVSLCDTVTVVFEKLGISTKSKVIKTTYDVLRERYDEVQIGEPNATLSSTIADQMTQISYLPTSSEMQKGIERATGVLNSGMRGHVVINRDPQGYANEILFLDNENIMSAKNVLRINMNGIGFSSTGYLGPYFQSWTNDGHLTLGGINNAYGDFHILDENAVPMVEIDKNGLRLFDNDAVIVGYLNPTNGQFYSDAGYTKVIAQHKGSLYYNYSDSKTYAWNGDAYVVSTDSTGLSAQMTHDGLGIYKGEIDLLMGEEIGFHADGNEIQIGGFKVEDTAGRQVFQSLDHETGISGNPEQSGGLYFWAFYNGGNYSFVVNSGGAYTKYGGEEFCIGEELYNIRHGISGGSGCVTYSSSGGCNDAGGCYTPSGDPTECTHIG